MTPIYKYTGLQDSTITISVYDMIVLNQLADYSMYLYH